MRKSFKSFCMFCVFTLVFSSTLVTYAAGTASFTVSSASANAGDNVTINISVGSGSKIGACELTLTYDANLAECLSAKAGSISGVISMSPNTSTPGQVKYSFATLNGLSNGGNVFSVNFKVKSSADKNIPIVLSFQTLVDINMAQITPSITNGTITVTAQSGSKDSYSSGVTSSNAEVNTNSQVVDSSQASATVSSINSYNSSNSSKQNAVSSSAASMANSSGSSAQSIASASSSTLVMGADAKSYTDKNTGVEVTSETPAEYILVANIDQASTYFQSIMQKLSDKQILQIYDVALLNSQAEAKTDGLVKIKIPLPKSYTGQQGLIIIHDKDDGTLESIIPQIVDSNLVFDVTGLSKFILAVDSPNLVTQAVPQNSNPIIVYVGLGVLVVAVLAFTAFIIIRAHKTKNKA